MILVTVGMQLPFDRLIQAMDELAPRLPLPVFAQTGLGSYMPSNMEWKASLPASEFDALLARTSLIVSHAGIGTVLMAQKLGRPIVLFPRRAAFGEHRNDHQIATVNQLHDRPGISVAMDVADLKQVIERGLAMETAVSEPPLARARLKRSIDSFIRTGAL